MNSCFLTASDNPMQYIISNYDERLTDGILAETYPRYMSWAITYDSELVKLVAWIVEMDRKSMDGRKIRKPHMTFNHKWYMIG
jgi:hypothetical protein